jgi:hypothetical protein
LRSSTPCQFAALIVVGVIVAVIVWSFLNHPMGAAIVSFLPLFC